MQLLWLWYFFQRKKKKHYSKLLTDGIFEYDPKYYISLYFLGFLSHHCLQWICVQSGRWDRCFFSNFCLWMAQMDNILRYWKWTKNLAVISNLWLIFQACKWTTYHWFIVSEHQATQVSHVSMTWTAFTSLCWLVWKELSSHRHLFLGWVVHNILFSKKKSKYSS